MLESDAKRRRSFLRGIDVEEVMSRSLVTVTPDTRVSEAARLLLRHRIGCQPVLDPQGAPVGLVTETDLLRAAYLSAGQAEGDGEE